jgi:glycine cleavage system H protein
VRAAWLPLSELLAGFIVGGDLPKEMLELTVDKFTFRVPKGLYYNDAGVWVSLEGNVARLGLADFAQQRSGDMAFAEVKPVGTALKPGVEFASVETIKVNLSLPSPVTGKMVEVNSALGDAPEWINRDPYGNGWLAVVELTDWSSDQARLLDADAYYALIKSQAEEEAK